MLPGGVELGARLPVDEEDIGALDGCAALHLGDSVTVGERGLLEAGDEAEFADGGFGGGAGEGCQYNPRSERG